MKKYNVENKVDNYEQYIGEIPHEEISDNYFGDYIDAENEEIAIEIYKDKIMEMIRDNNFECEQEETGNIIVFEEDGKVREYWYDFKAKEKE